MSAPERLSQPFRVPLGTCQGDRQSFDVATDGSALAVGLDDGTIKIFNLATGKDACPSRHTTAASAAGDPRLFRL